MNPFPGLRPFTQEEDFLFFGREEQTMELLKRLAGNRFVAVVGTSGSGKSSLVRCGLLSQLLGGKMLEAGGSWEIAVTHPGGNPLALVNRGEFLIPRLNREQYKRVIVGPIRVAGGKIAPRLLQRLLNDLGQQGWPGAALGPGFAARR